MLSLEPTNKLAKPVFTDAATCSLWLSQLQLTNLNLAHSTLRAQLNEFNRYPTAGKNRLQTLEALRETVTTVQTDSAKKLFGKKLPLADDEFTALIAIMNLWHGMLNGYLRCLESLDAGDSSLTADGALLSHRCLLYSSLQIGEFLRMGYEPDAVTWQRFHTLYKNTEKRNLHLEAVADQFNRSGQTTTCRTLYAKTLLLHRTRLLGLPRNQLHIVDRWLEQWAATLTVERSCSMSKEDAPPLAVDLSGTRGLVSIQQATSASSMRYLAMVPLSKLIRVKTILLQQGQSPQQMELGSELNSKECSDLLNKLHRCWCEQRKESFADEPVESAVVRLCSGLEGLYAHVARKPFKQPDSLGVADKEAQKQIEAFGRVLDDTDRHNLAQLGFLAEEWMVEDDSLLQARLLRKAASKERLGLNQIIGINKADAAVYKVGIVTLVNVTRNAQLYIGVRYLPGNPQAVIISGHAADNFASGAAAGLILPEMPHLNIPASLVIPRDWFHSGRYLDLTLRDGGKQKVLLGISVEKGNDYERVSFTIKG